MANATQRTQVSEWTPGCAGQQGWSPSFLRASLALLKSSCSFIASVGPVVVAIRMIWFICPPASAAIYQERRSFGNWVMYIVLALISTARELGVRSSPSGGNSSCLPSRNHVAQDGYMSIVPYCRQHELNGRGQTLRTLKMAVYAAGWFCRRTVYFPEKAKSQGWKSKSGEQNSDTREVLPT